MENFQTLRKIVYRVWERVRGNISPDDTLNDNIIETDIVNIRSILLRQDFAKYRNISNALKQRISSVKMIEVNSSTDFVGYNKNFMRSLNKLPRTIERQNRETLTSITIGYDDRAAVALLDFNAVSYVGFGRFNSRKTYAFLHEEYLYLYNPYISSKIDDGTYSGYAHYFIENILDISEPDDPSVVQSSNVSFDINIKDNNGFPLENIDVIVTYIDADGNTITSTISTDEDGNASTTVPTLTEITYTITETGYESYSGTTTLYEEVDVDIYEELPSIQYDQDQYTPSQYN